MSEREVAVLERLVNGATNREIARDLHISHNTVKVHLRNVFAKLDVSSRTEATTLALQKGLVSLPGVTAAPAVAISPPITSQHPAELGQAEASERPAFRPRALPWRPAGYGLVAVLAVAAGLLAWQLLRGDGSNRAGQAFVEELLGDTRWLVGRPLPRARASMALATVGLNLYQIGGEMAAGVVNLVDVYETDSREWHAAEPKPTAVADVTAAVLFGEIYVPGGRLADGRPTAVVEAYSPANNAWRPVSPLPRPLAGALVLSGGSLLYLFGGWDGQAYLAESYVYDPGEDNWRTIPPMSYGRAFAAGGVLSNRLYVVGGYDGRQELAACEYFDPAVQAWFDCPGMLLPRAGAGAAVLNNNLLYVLGGGISRQTPTSEVYDSTTNTWETVDMPMLGAARAWYNLGVASVETRIYALGGRQDDAILPDSYVYAPFVHQTFLPAVGVDER